MPVFISSAFAQTAPAAAAAGGKEHRAMIDALAKGDEVATAGGMLGKVSSLSEGYMSLEISAGVEVQVQRSAVIQVLPKGTIK
jgi:preprotein translocase subunit YajC